MSPAVSSGWAASSASASSSPPCHVAALMNAERKSVIALAQHLVAVTRVRFHLPFHHFVINTTRPYQILVRAALNDGAILHQQNQIGAPDSGQPVRDDEGGAVGEQIGHRGLNQLLALGVEVAGRLVQDEDLRRRQDRASDGEPLLLAARQLHTPLPDPRPVTLWQADDEPVRLC